MKLDTTHGTVHVRFRHYATRPRPNAPMQRGTSAQVSGPGIPWATAHVTCDSRTAFVKDTGRKLALAKALAAAGIPRSYRANIWFAYLAGRGERGLEKALAGRRVFMLHRARRREQEVVRLTNGANGGDQHGYAS